MNKLEEYRQLIHTTVKDITWIGTEISDDKQSINIKVVFGSRFVLIPVSIEDIDKNLHSAKGFIDLIVPTLEVLLPYPEVVSVGEQE